MVDLGPLTLSAVGEGPFRTPSPPPAEPPEDLSGYPMDGKLTVVDTHEVANSYDLVVDVVHHGTKRHWRHLWLVKGRLPRKASYYNKKSRAYGVAPIEEFYGLHGKMGSVLSDRIEESMRTVAYRRYLLSKGGL